MKWALLALVLSGCGGTFYRQGAQEFDKHYDVFQCEREGGNTEEKLRACMAAKGWAYR